MNRAYEGRDMPEGLRIIDQSENYVYLLSSMHPVSWILESLLSIDLQYCGQIQTSYGLAFCFIKR